MNGDIKMVMSNLNNQIDPKGVENFIHAKREETEEDERSLNNYHDTSRNMTVLIKNADLS